MKPKPIERGNMRIMLVCAGGMSTSILMKKMEKYAVEKGVELDIKAFAAQDLEDNYQQYEDRKSVV